MSGFGMGTIDFEPGDQDAVDDELTPGDPDFDWTPAAGDDINAGPPTDPDQGAFDSQHDPISGGVNLLPHSSFESAKDWDVGPGWTVPYGWGSAFHGAAVARIVANGTHAILASTAVIAVDPAKVYWASFESFMFAYTSGSGRMLLREFDSTGLLLRELVVGEHAALSTTWVRYAIKLTPRAALRSDVEWHVLTAFVQVAFEAAGASSFDWRVDGAQLERGDISTVYAPAPNEDVHGSELADGSVPSTAFDITPPSVPVIGAITSETLPEDDGTFKVHLHVALTQPPEADTAGIELEATNDVVTDNSGIVLSVDWTHYLFTFVPVPDAVGTFHGVLADTPYQFRARSIDQIGNRSAWSAEASFLSGADGEAPGVPQGVQAMGVIRGLLITWPLVTAPDLSHFEIRIRLTGTLGDWTIYRQRGTVITVTGLTATEDTTGAPTTSYDVQVRAVDSSGQVQTSLISPIPVDADGNPEAGWSAVAVGAPTLTHGADIAAATIVAGNIKAGEITTDKLGAGEILINTTTDPLRPDGITIRQGAGIGAPELSRWDDTGLTIWASAADHTSYLKLTGGALSIVKQGVATTGITTDGISATAITFGTAPGGHNLVFNSSFELNAFSSTQATIVDTVAADWSGNRVGSVDNLTEAANNLAMTATAF